MLRFDVLGHPEYLKTHSQGCYIDTHFLQKNLKFNLYQFQHLRFRHNVVKFLKLSRANINYRSKDKN